VRDAAWGCDWVGTPVPFQRCLAFIIAAANKEFTLTAGKFVPVSNKTMMNVSTRYSVLSQCVHNAYWYILYILGVSIMKDAVMLLSLAELIAPFTILQRPERNVQ
jgi:hypothetical protein